MRQKIMTILSAGLVLAVLTFNFKLVFNNENHQINVSLSGLMQAPKAQGEDTADLGKWSQFLCTMNYDSGIYELCTPSGNGNSCYPFGIRTRNC